MPSVVEFLGDDDPVPPPRPRTRRTTLLAAVAAVALVGAVLAVRGEHQAPVAAPSPSPSVVPATAIPHLTLAQAAVAQLCDGRSACEPTADDPVVLTPARRAIGSDVYSEYTYRDGGVIGAVLTATLSDAEVVVVVSGAGNELDPARLDPDEPIVEVTASTPTSTVLAVATGHGASALLARPAVTAWLDGLTVPV